MPVTNTIPDSTDTPHPAALPQSPILSSSSFVYPVKSLLTGKIYPAVEKSSPSSSSVEPAVKPRRRSFSDVDSGNLFNVDHSQTSELLASVGHQERDNRTYNDLDIPSTSSSGFTAAPMSKAQESPAKRRENIAPALSVRPRSHSFSSSDKSSKVVASTSEPSGTTHKKRKSSKKLVPNYRHFPAGSQTKPKRFSAIQAASSSTAVSPTTPGTESSPVLEIGPIESFMTKPEAMPNAPLPLIAADALGATATALSPHLPAVTTLPKDDYSNVPAYGVHEPNLPEEPLDPTTPGAILTTQEQEPAVGAQEEEEEALPFNLSEYGIVHLLPLPPSRENSSEGDTSRFDSQPPVTVPSSRADSISISQPSSGRGSSNRKRRRIPGSIEEKGSGSKDLKISSQSNSHSSANDSSSSSEPLVNFQYQHVEDENGHHVVIGREGQLQRCEDEPIRTPGAVQGFGVLIAVDDMEDTLVVRQVSENAAELLGLPPAYLFSLECFTDALPEDQVDVLWDNIHFLTEPEPSSNDDDNAPHVFLLSGWGAPGSALPGDPHVFDGKRTWTCWCAVHRAEGYTSPDSLNSGLIIIEFELERDNLSPLYPSPDVILPPVASSSPSGRLFTGGKNSPASQGSGSASDSADTATPSPPMTVQPPSEEGTKPGGLEGDDEWMPSTERILESTTSYSKPIPALERLRRISRGTTSPGGTEGARSGRKGNRRPTRDRGSGVGMMDVFAVMAQINEQIGAAPDLDTFLKIVVGVIKDLTQFHRVMIYQFDDMWNGQVVAELVDWTQSHDLFRGLHFPAADIPAQARQLYAINKVRLLYDRSQPNARIVCRSKEDLVIPLDMTHCYLRAMSPIHVKYLENMGVRASMSVSTMAFGQLWGLVTCHTYGQHGMRVSFPVRQILRLLSQSISRNIERLSYAQRLHTRKLVNTIASNEHPTGSIVSNADDLFDLFDADFGILVIGEGAKIIGTNQHGQEILIMAEYLRLKQFDTIQASQSVISDYPDLKLTAGLEVIAGLLYVPLSRGGRDFIAFLRRGQPRAVNWAGKPLKEGQGPKSLEPRTSFKIWSENVAGRCRAWTDEQLETAGVLALVYGKFIEVWRQKQSAVQSNKLANLILNNASHEVRTPLNHIINYLEMALNGSLDNETRENLSRSHAASKSLLFTINDLLDLTRLESGNETSFHEPFNLHTAIEEAVYVYKQEAQRRGVEFNLELKNSPSTVVGDSKKIRTVVQNLTANALKYTVKGVITVTCSTFEEPQGLRDENQAVIETVVADTGCGVEPSKLESIFREFEQVESPGNKNNAEAGVGLGLAVVARIVKQLGGQLRVESLVGQGSRFSFLIPLTLSNGVMAQSGQRNVSPSRSSGHSSYGVSPSLAGSDPSSTKSGKSEIENFVDALSSNHLSGSEEEHQVQDAPGAGSRSNIGSFPVTGSQIPIRPVKIDTFEREVADFTRRVRPLRSPAVEKEDRLGSLSSQNAGLAPPSETSAVAAGPAKLRVLIVEDNDINRIILDKRLIMDGHTVVNTANGQEGLEMVERDRAFDAVFMDIQMPILNGFEATERIREVESTPALFTRPSWKLNNGRIPIFAVSASLKEAQREQLVRHGMDGWILKPIDFKRLSVILKGVFDPVQRQRDLYSPGCDWERGGWLTDIG